MADLNQQFGVGIDPCPSLELGVATQVANSVHARYVLTGASHLDKLADHMGLGICLPGPGNP